MEIKCPYCHHTSKERDPQEEYKPVTENENRFFKLSSMAYREVHHTKYITNKPNPGMREVHACPVCFKVFIDEGRLI